MPAGAPPRSGPRGAAAASGSQVFTHPRRASPHGARRGARRRAQAKSKLAADSSLRICMYHGTNRERDPRALAKYDLVVTTYQTLATDFGPPNSPLHCVRWWRVLLVRLSRSRIAAPIYCVPI
jgi:hypothetical protein